MRKRYRGRHRAPSPTARVVGALAAGGTAAVALPLAGAPAAQAAEQPTIDLSPIAACESSNNPRATNGSHFGLFQFDLATWRSVGGAGNPIDASVAEQYQRAQALYAARGTQPWLASQACWSGKLTVAAPAQTPARTPPAPVRKPSWAAAAAGRSTPPGRQYTVRSGDTLSGIAAKAGKPSWRAVFEANRGVIGANPNLIRPGQVLAL